MELKRHIYLIGFMGTGKSTNAGMLSQLTGARLFEMDQEIVRERQMEITEIFDTCGEEGFRDLETSMLKRLSERAPSIMSCGGGIVLRAENVRIMRETGKIVLLTASPSTVLSRVKDSGERPVLNGHMDSEYIRELMEKRRELYESAADIVISTDGRSARDICLEILRQAE